MILHPDDRVLVAVMNNKEDWRRVQEERWYRIPTKHAPEGAPHFDYLAFYFTSAFGSDKWAIHYYAHIEGHELVTRRDLVPAEPGHKRASDWYYKLQIGPIQYKLPPIVSYNWRRITFLVSKFNRRHSPKHKEKLYSSKLTWKEQRELESLETQWQFSQYVPLRMTWKFHFLVSLMSV